VNYDRNKSIGNKGEQAPHK